MKQKWLSMQNKNETYKIEAHSFVSLKQVGRQYCRKCGLIAVNNELSQWAVRMGCNYSDHPSYQATIHRFTKPKWID